MPASDARSERPAGGSGLGSGLIWNLGSAVLPLLGSFVVSVLLFPHLGREGTGHYVLAMAAATFFLIVGKFGVQAAASRLVSEHEEEAGRWIRAGLWVRSVFTLPTSLAALLTAPLLARLIDGPALVPAFWWVAPVVLTASYYEITGELLVGLRAYPRLFATRVLFLALRVAAVFWVREAHLGAAAFLAGHAVAQGVTALWVGGGLLAGHPAPSDAALRREARRRTLRVSVPLALSSASFLVFAQMDKLMVGWMRDAATAGDFGVARTVLDAALFPTFALGWSLRPDLVGARRRGDPAEVRARLAEGLRWSSVYAFGTTALVLVLGPPLLLALFRADFTAAADLLRWMAPLLFLRGAGAVVFPALLAADDQDAYARLMLWTAGINLAANLALIPPFGGVGAVLATFLSLLPLTVVGLLRVRSRLGSLPLADHLPTHLVCAVLAGLLVLFGPSVVPEGTSTPGLLARGTGLGLLYLIPAVLAGRRRRG